MRIIFEARVHEIILLHVLAQLIFQVLMPTSQVIHVPPACYFNLPLSRVAPHLLFCFLKKHPYLPKWPPDRTESKVHHPIIITWPSNDDDQHLNLLPIRTPFNHKLPMEPRPIMGVDVVVPFLLHSPVPHPSPLAPLPLVALPPP